MIRAVRTKTGVVARWVVWLVVAGVCSEPSFLQAKTRFSGPGKQVTAPAKMGSGATADAEKGGASPAQGAKTAGVGATAGAVSASAQGATPGEPKVSTATAALKSEDANAALAARIASLPKLAGTNIDVAKRNTEVRAHLNAVLRYYRAATVPIQKTGEPSDVLYAEQSESEATQIAELAFQAAKNEAALLANVSGGGAASGGGSAEQATPAPDGEAQRLGSVRAQAQARLTALQQQETALQQQAARARGDQRAALLQQQEQIEGGIKLQQAMVDALGRVNTLSAAQVQTGLAGDIDRLQRSAPELMSKPVKTPAPPVLQSLATVRDSAVSTQAVVLFQFMSALRTIDNQTKTLDVLSKQVTDLRTPFVKVLRTTIAQGQALTQQAVDLKSTPTTDAQDIANTRQQFDQLTTTFQVLADATLPLSQEAVLIDNARGTLTTWRATVNAEYKELLRHLLIRVVSIAIALIVLAVLNKVLSKATVKYVSDLRRRRHLLLLRRIVMGFLTGLVLIFGVVTQFSSLATFAGFITAGIAVGLQSILLSVAAYFFIVGRYGVRVGDRITVANVTGEVIEVGLVRFYMMELVGTGTELHSTGRVAVFANSILFQTGTPIYKQMPGTEYAWHELTAKLNANADVPAASKQILDSVSKVYATYSERINNQHQQVEGWMGTALPAPKVQSRLQLVDGTLQFAVLFPVEINNAAATDQAIAEELVREMRAEGPLKAGVSELPVIKAAVKS